MKIGVITLTPKNNYGGAMQSYALVKVLRDMGHEAYLIILPRTDRGLDRANRSAYGTDRCGCVVGA